MDEHPPKEPDTPQQPQQQDHPIQQKQHPEQQPPSQQKKDAELESPKDEPKQELSKKQQKKQKQQAVADQKKKKKQEETALKEEKKQETGGENKPEKKEKSKKKDKNIEISPEELEEFNSQKIVINPNKTLPIQGKNNILITSALPYVNNVPHLGNIIGCVLSADVFARFKRLQGDNTLYICGTDQYGTATQVKALQQNKTPKQICDFYYAIHKDVYEWFDISFDYFGRTSTDWHAKICQQIFLNIQKNGKILKQKMTQCCCQKCDMFLADRFIGGTCPFCLYPDARGDQCDKCQKLFNSPTQMKDYFCTICKSKPVEKQTEHFFIDLPGIQKQLETWIDISSVAGKWSQNSIAMTKGWINQGLQPKCITRDLKWGVPLPIQQYKTKVFYVWFDAPIGYISITANFLQENFTQWWRNPSQVKLYQFMGKDNVPFHTVIFPSSLIAANKDWTLLHHISTTEYLNYESGKFSKRNGTGVFGDSAKQTGIPVEVFRYYLLVNRPQKSDSEFSWNDFTQKNNNELLANVGNLCHRALKFAYSEYGGQIPKIDIGFGQLDKQDQQFIETIQKKYGRYVELLTNVEIKDGLKAAMEISSIGNKYLQDSKFWEEENKKSGRTNRVIAIICNFIRLISLIFQPYIPSTSAKINYLLGLHKTEDDEVLGQLIEQAGFLNYFFLLTQNSKGLRKPIPLFTEFTTEQTEQWREKFKGTTNVEKPQNQPQPQTNP